MKLWPLTSVLIIPALLATMPGKALSSEANGVPPSPKKAVELDEKALWAKKSAVRALTAVARKESKSPNAPALLLRLAEMNEDIAAIQYRLTFAKATPQKPADTSEYISYMNAAIEPLNRLITAYPNFKSISRAYYLRSKALAEMSRTNEAISDLRHLVSTWPTSHDASVGNMDLWRLLIQQKDYTSAIQAINRYGLKPTDKYYHAALEKLSWCHYYLGAVPEALRYTESELASVKGLERDKALSNYALFYVTGVERHTPGVDPNDALARFRKSASGNDLGTLIVSYAYLLRAKALDPQLDAFKDGALKENIPDTFKSDVLLIAFENQYNRRKVVDMKASAEQEIALVTKSSIVRKDVRRFGKVKTTFNDTIPGLQKLLVGAPEQQSQAISATLRICYQFMLESSEGDVFEQSRIHFNMAEVSLEMKEFTPATEHYRWIVDRLNDGKKEHQELFQLASIKALDSRYAEIKQNGWAPTNLTAKKLNVSGREVPKPVMQWIGWIDQFPKAAFLTKKADAHAFEANRILYSFDQVDKATSRLLTFAEQWPTSSFAVSSASLVMDTYIASEKWDDAYVLAKKYLAVKEWKGTPFAARLVDLASDIYCKVLDHSYRDKKFDLTIQSAEAFVAENPTSKRRGDMLELAANAALATGNRVKASEIFKKLLDSGTKKPEITSLAYMTQASLSEEKFDFAEAAKSYRVAAAQAGTISDDLRAKILLWSWLSGNPKDLDETLGSERICQRGKGKELCAQYVRRYEETYGAVPKSAEDRSSAPIARLAVREKIPNKERTDLLKSLVDEWTKRDAMERAAALPILVSRIPEQFRALRERIQKISPLELNRASIAKRTRLIEEAQSTVEKIAAIPSMRIHLDLIREIAVLYEDAAHDLLGVPISRAIKGDARKEVKQALAEGAASFTAKADELHKAEHELASQKGIEATPEQANRWATLILQQVDGKAVGNWFEPFKQALDKGDWQLSAFLLERPGVAPEPLSLLRAAMLARSGATAEALEEIRHLPPQKGADIEVKLGFTPTNKPAQVRMPASVPASSNASGGNHGKN